MAVQSDFYRSFAVSTAMSAFRRVLVAPDGKVAYATTTNRGIGVLQNDVAGNSYEVANVRLWGTGTQKMAVAGSTGIAIGDYVYGCINGQLSPTVTGSITTGLAMTLGVALEAPAALADIIEVMPTYTL